MEKIIETRSKIAIFCNGQQISPYKFTGFEEVNGYIIAYNSTSFTIFDSNAIPILSKKMKIELIDDEFIIVSKSNYKGVYRFDGKLIVPVKFDGINLYDTGIIVEKDGLYGLYSYDGKRIVPVKFDDINFEDDGIVVEKNGLYGLYSYDGKLIVSVEFLDISITYTGIIEVLSERNGSYRIYQE